MGEWARCAPIGMSGRKSAANHLVEWVHSLADMNVTSLCQQMGIDAPTLKTSDLTSIDTAKDAQVGRIIIQTNPRSFNRR